MNYTLILPDEDRQAIAAALGKLVQALTNAAPVIDLHGSSVALETAQASTDFVRSGAQTSTAKQAPSLPNPADPPRASAAQTPTSEARDRWATDKAGNPWKATSRGISAIDVHIWKTEQADAYLRVTWEAPQARGFGNGNCFDSELWPWLIARSKQPQATRLYIRQSGPPANYTNIVGVRA